MGAESAMALPLISKWYIFKYMTKDSRAEEKGKAMERRKHKRIYFDVKAGITLGDKTYEGYIGNVSESGIGYLITSSVMLKDDVPPYEIIDLSFKTPEGRRIELQCEVRWSKKGLFSGKTTSLGMRIIDPPPEYDQWLKEESESGTTESSDNPEDQD
ncbi:MAG: hypothetical protein AMK71_12025 [Nitrospira bacterium SG8_35_4]|nr:MAG: hypothetical protein AMK71_12025 [Nitrospira bacterium SG8_35_4]